MAILQLRPGRLRQGTLELVVEPLVVNDAIGAIRSGTDDGVGVAAICGTGGAVGARNGRGEIFHLGFWPDGTGAFALGSAGLAAVWRAGIGVGPETSLTARALARWECPDSLSLLHAFTRLGGLGELPSERSRFADAVLDEAAAGDSVAAGIVELAGIGRLKARQYLDHPRLARNVAVAWSHVKSESATGRP